MHQCRMRDFSEEMPKTSNLPEGIMKICFQCISKAIILLFYTFVNIFIYFCIYLSIQLSTDEATIYTISAT